MKISFVNLCKHFKKKMINNLQMNSYMKYFWKEFGLELDLRKQN